MRLSVQGCLILGLCLLSGLSSADTIYNSRLDQCGTEQASINWAEANKSDCENAATECYYTVTFEGNSDCHWQEGYGSWEAIVYKFTACQDPLVRETDENGNPICVQPSVEPEACYENGEIYDAQNQQCVTSCPEGALNGVCLELPANNEENCNADSPDYQGFIGNGNTKMNLCESNRQCEGGAFGVVNGTPACIPDEYGPPTCDVSTVAVLDEYGFVCADPQDAPEPGQEPDEWWKDEEPNTDTDGDGEPDEYDPGNDPTSVDKGLDKINQGIAEGNKNSKGTNDRLDKIGKGVAKSNELQDEANGVANDTRNTVKEINEKLDGPDDGYNTEGLGDAPTFAESSERLQASFAGNPTIQAVTTIPSIASNNTCPVWTIPATDYWSAMPIDSHCTILNDHRGLLSMLFIAVWTLAAVFVFLRA